MLHRALTRPRAERAREALRSPAEHAAAKRLIAAGLLEDNDGVLLQNGGRDNTKLDL